MLARQHLTCCVFSMFGFSFGYSLVRRVWLADWSTIVILDKIFVLMSVFCSSFYFMPNLCHRFTEVSWHHHGLTSATVLWHGLNYELRRSTVAYQGPYTLILSVWFWYFPPFSMIYNKKTCWQECVITVWHVFFMASLYHSRTPSLPCYSWFLWKYVWQKLTSPEKWNSGVHRITGKKTTVLLLTFA